MKNNISKIVATSLVSLLMFGVAIPTVTSIKVAADEVTLATNYNVLLDNDETRTVEIFSELENQYITYTYHKKTGFLDIIKDGQAKSYNVISIGENALLAAGIGGFRDSNSSLFSPWSYSSSGNRYTLRITHISYGGKTVSKTANRSGRNAGYIDAFKSNIDDLRNAEWGIVTAAGWELGSAVIGALLTGGVGAVAAITGVVAIYNAANALPPIYDKALYNYNNIW